MMQATDASQFYEYSPDLWSDTEEDTEEVEEEEKKGTNNQSKNKPDEVDEVVQEQEKQEKQGHSSEKINGESHIITAAAKTFDLATAVRRLVVQKTTKKSFGAQVLWFITVIRITYYHSYIRTRGILWSKFNNRR